MTTLALQFGLLYLGGPTVVERLNIEFSATTNGRNYHVIMIFRHFSCFHFQREEGFFRVRKRRKHFFFDNSILNCEEKVTAK